jgi:hypothetical protein
VSLRRWLPYATIAVAAHLAALAALRGPASGPAPLHVVTTETDLEVEVAPEATEPAAAAALPAPSEASRTRASTAPAMGGGRETVRGTKPDGATAAEASAQPSAPAPTTNDGWSFDPRRPVDILAPEAVARAAHEGAPRVDTAAEPITGVSKTGGLAEGLDAHDASIGLGRGGPVVSALEIAAASSEAPEGNATFDVAIDASGHVSVALLGASSAAGAWAKVGAAAGASIDPNRVRIPPGAHGWHVVATVEAKVQYPNGVDPKKLGTHVEASPSLALTENKQRATVEDPPIVFKKTPGITIAHAGKVCSVAITIGLSFGSGISGGCDPSNIGSHALRVVRSHVVSEGRL